jgi:hypothetical protein
MLASSKAQVSVETLIAVFVVLIFFATVLVQTSLIGASETVAEKTFSEKNSCLKLSHLISQTYTEGKGAHSEIYLDHPAQIFADEKIVKVGENFCYFIARTENKNLDEGIIQLDNNGIVRFS